MKEIVYFLKLDGIQGESTDEKYKGHIDLLSYSFGSSQMGTASASGGGSGKVELQPLQATARSSKASPRLFLACVSGQHIKEAVLTAARKKKNGKLQEFIIIKLVDVAVASYQISGELGAQPVDTFSLTFMKIEFKYYPFKEDGSLDAPVEAGWDVKANKPV
jgi:type VI secretion system secreted protein Hcp